VGTLSFFEGGVHPFWTPRALNFRGFFHSGNCFFRTGSCGFFRNLTSQSFPRRQAFGVGEGGGWFSRALRCCCPATSERLLLPNRAGEFEISLGGLGVENPQRGSGRRPEVLIC
jgi:hypothetical protein